jgi:hypothetical protein
VGDALGIRGGQSEDDMREAGVDAASAAGEIRPGLDPLELLCGVGNLCIGVPGGLRYDARRLVGLLIAGLAQPQPGDR